MKGLKKIALASAIAAASVTANAEMQALDDAFLGEVTGQTGIGIDLDLAVRIGQILYVDSDGFSDPVLATTGTQGRVGIENVLIGRLNDAGDDFAIDATTGESDAAVSINNITIDVDGTDGVVIGFGDIGNFGDGIDFAADFVINPDTTGANPGQGDAGRFIVRDFTNEATDDIVNQGNALFGLNVLTPSALTGGASTSSFIDNRISIQGRSDGSSGLDISADFGGLIGSAGWFDNDTGKGIGFSQLALFRELPGPGGASIPAPLRVDFSVDVGTNPNNGVDSLILTGIEFEGNIAIGDIFIGDAPAAGQLRATNSIGSVLIRDIDLQETTVYIYAQ